MYIHITYFTYIFKPINWINYLPPQKLNPGSALVKRLPVKLQQQQSHWPVLEHCNQTNSCHPCMEKNTILVLQTSKHLRVSYYVINFSCALLEQLDMDHWLQSRNHQEEAHSFLGMHQQISTMMKKKLRVTWKIYLHSNTTIIKEWKSKIFHDV